MGSKAKDAVRIMSSWMEHSIDGLQPKNSLGVSLETKQGWSWLKHMKEQQAIIQEDELSH